MLSSFMRLVRMGFSFRGRGRGSGRGNHLEAFEWHDIDCEIAIDVITNRTMLTLLGYVQGMLRDIFRNTHTCEGMSKYVR